MGKDIFKHDTLAMVKSAHIEINLWSLLTNNEIEFKSISLEKPEINIYVLSDGKANYDIVNNDSAASSKPSSLKIAIDRASIEEGKIVYKDQQRNIFVEAIGLEHTGNGDFLKDVFDYQTKTTIDHFSLNFNKIQYFHKRAIDLDLVLEMNLPESKFTFKENRIQINHFVFGVEGFFQQVIDRYAMNLKFKAQETSFKNILSLVPGLYLKNFDYMETHGDMSFDGFLEGILSSSTNELPAFHLGVKVKNAMVKIDSLPEAFNNIQFDLTIDNRERILDSTVVDLKEFHVDLGKHPVHGRIKMEGLKKPKIDADVMADVDIASLEKMFPIKSFLLKGKVNFELKAKGTLDRENSTIPTFALSLRLKDGFIRYDSFPKPISNVQFHLNAENKNGELESTKIELHQIHAELDDNILHGLVKTKGFKNPEIDADVDADLDLFDIEKIYPLNGYQLNGKLNLDLLVKGIYNKTENKFPFVDAKMKLLDGLVQYKNYPPLKNIHFYAEAVNKTGKLGDATLNIGKFAYTLADEPFEVSGTLVDLNNYQYDFNVNGKIDLSKLASIYPVDGVELAGLIDAQFKTSGLVSDLENGNYARVSSSGKIIVSNVKVMTKEIKAPILINTANLVFTPSKIILQDLDGKLGKGSIKMNGDITNYMSFVTSKNDLITGDLNFVCDTLDINEWMPRAQTATGKPVPATDTTHAKLTVIEVPKNLNFIFDSKIGYVKYEDLTITNMDGDIVVKDGVLSLNETGFNSLNAKFSFDADYNTRDLNHPLFDMKLNVSDLDINRAYKEVKLFRDLAPSAANTYGKFSVDYKLKGELAKDMTPKLGTLIGGGVMRIADAKINGMKLFEEISKSAKKSEINDPHLKDFTMETEIRDNKIIVKPFSIKVSGFDTDIEGVNTMTGMVNYLVKIELLPLVKIPFHVTGKYDNPKVALGKGHKLPY
ncbi:MAG TPA: outer membrane assembly protein [Cytophagales bacterium]|nr:outer membrane assembly protein [Cytophagales bacterium]